RVALHLFIGPRRGLAVDVELLAADLIGIALADARRLDLVAEMAHAEDGAAAVVVRHGPARGADPHEQPLGIAVLPEPADLTEIRRDHFVEADPDMVAEPAARQVVHAVAEHAPFGDRHLAPRRRDLRAAHAAVQEHR